MNKQLIRFVAAVAVGCALLAATALAVAGAFWHTEPFSPSENDSVGKTASVAVGTGQNVAVVWTRKPSPAGVVVRESQAGESWASPVAVGVPSGQQAWQPDMVYRAGQTMVAWTEGEAESPNTLARRVMQQDEGKNPNVVLEDIYGDVAPKLATDNDGIHVIFAAATADNVYWEDLYYGYRDFASASWTPPEILVHHDDHIDPGPNTYGRIRHPEIAVDPLEETIHIVWSQEQTSFEGGTEFSVWYISGQWQGPIVEWSNPVRISPADHRYAVRPGVAAENGNVHITWTLLYLGATGSLASPEAQYVYYQRLEDSTPKRLSTSPIKVNNWVPTWAASSIGAGGSNVCVAWHGFYSTLDTTLEEILVRCSENNGGSWQVEDNVSKSTDLLSIWPSVNLNSEGQVFITWTEFTLAGTALSSESVHFRGGDVRGKSRVLMPLVMRNS
jgi:hypothetical protein